MSAFRSRGWRIRARRLLGLPLLLELLACPLAGSLAWAGAAPAVPPYTGPVRAMTQTEVYELLQAELLLRRGDNAAGFRKYLQLARSTRDAGVIGFAIRVGGYLDRAEVTELAQLWVRAEPNALEPHRVLARRLQSTGQWRGALDQWMRARQLGGRDRLDSWLEVTTEIADGVEPTPLTAVREWRRTRATDTELLRAEAMLLLRSGRTAEGLATLARHPEQTPDILETRLGAYLELGDVAGAQAVIAVAAARGMDVREWRYEVALEHVRAMRLEQARSDLQQLIDAGWNNAEALLTQAYVALRLGDPVLARAMLTRTPATEAINDLRALYAGQTAEQERHYGEALEWYRRVQPGEHFVNAQTRIAYVRARSGKLAEARAELAALRTRYPEDDLRYVLVEAGVLTDIREPLRAIAVLNARLAEQPMDPELLLARAAAYRVMSNDGSVEADLRTVLRQDPDDVRAMQTLALHLADRTRRSAEALTLAQRALSLAPEDPAAIDAHGWVLFRAGRRAEALPRLQDAYRRSRDVATAARLGEALWTAGQQAEARRIWNEAQRVEPDHRELRLTVERFLGRRAAP